MNEKFITKPVHKKHLDFVLYDLRKNDVLLVIELDDPSHLKERVQQRDRVKDDILDDVGIPILRIPTSKTYDINALREKISLGLPLPEHSVQKRTFYRTLYIPLHFHISISVGTIAKERTYAEYQPNEEPRYQTGYHRID